jgi:hypothetical protein
MLLILNGENLLKKRTVPTVSVFLLVRVFTLARVNLKREEIPMEFNGMMGSKGGRVVVT